MIYHDENIIINHIKDKKILRKDQGEKEVTLKGNVNCNECIQININVYPVAHFTVMDGIEAGADLVLI